MNETKTSLDRVASQLALVTAIVLGLSAGAMLAEGALLVPYWRSLPAEEFLRWFAAHEPRLTAFYGPLEVVGALLAVAAAGSCSFGGRAGGGLFTTSAVLAFGVIAVYPLYFQGTNARFVAGTIHPGDVAAELARWGSWQWARIAIGLGAFVAALLGIRRRGV